MSGYNRRAAYRNKLPALHAEARRWEARERAREEKRRLAIELRQARKEALVAGTPTPIEDHPAFQTPKTGIPEIDEQVVRLQAEDAARRAAARAKAEAATPTPNHVIGGDRRVDSV